jgi:hypothetical protein
MVETGVASANLTWDMEVTRHLVEIKFGIHQRERFNSYTKPFNHRFFHGRYHFQEIERLLREAIDEKLVEKDIIEILLVDFDQFQPTLIKIEAHMIACAQAIHSITDIFAHAVYFALGMDLTGKPLKDKSINFKNVINSINEDRFLVVRESMTELLAHDLYKDLENLVIQGKHRGLVEPTIAVKLENQLKPYTLHFSEKFQSEREFQEFLSPIYAMTSQMTVRTGILINQVLSK